MALLWFIAVGAVGFIACVFIAFLVEVGMLLLGQRTARPSTLIEFMARWANRVLHAVGEFWTILPDVWHWARRLLDVASRLLRCIVPREIIDQARADLGRATTACLHVPLACLDGFATGLRKASCIAIVLVLPTAIVAIAIWQIICLQFRLPAPFIHPFWYASMVAEALGVFPQLFQLIGELISDIPAGVQTLVVLLKGMVSDDVRAAFLVQSSVIVGQCAEVPWYMWVSLASAVLTYINFSMCNTSAPSTHGTEITTDAVRPRRGGRTRRAMNNVAAEST